MIKNGYASRNIPSFEQFEDVYNRRIAAKKSGDKQTANNLKLILNTCYGATLNRYNKLNDPLNARSVCISGQLYLVELAMHLYQDIPDLKVVSLNTDGILIEFDDSHYSKVLEITQEWQQRTGFELEEDKIRQLIQKDVNGYCMTMYDGKVKIKGGVLVRGIAPAGAFNVNNNACVVAKAVKDYLAYGVPVEQTVMECDRLLDFQFIAKTWAKCGNAFHDINGKLVETQRVNRVYATTDYRFGTLYMLDPDTNNYRKMTGLPEKCVVDNDNHLTIDVVDRDWYIRLAKRYVRDFLGLKPPKRNTRRVNPIKKKLLEMLEV